MHKDYKDNLIAANPQATCRTEEVGGLIWQGRAPFIEASSYLVSSDGSGCLDALGKEVVFVKEGYFEQCKVLGAPSLHPIWTSFGLRRWQALWQTGAKEETQQLGIAKQSADLVERCKVIGVSFHQVIGPGMCCQTPISDPDTQGNNVLPGSQEGLQACMPESAQEQDFPAAALQLPHHNAAEATIGPEDFEEAKGKYFVRVALQRLPRTGERMGPVSLTIDHFVDVGVGEWIVPRERFEKTASSPWLAGDSIKMFWAESGGRGHGQWYEGTVLGYDRRAKDNPLRGSPWASVSVQWKDDHTDGETYENLISPWELAAAGDDSEQDEVDAVTNEALSESEMDEDWYEGQLRGLSSRSRQRSSDLQSQGSANAQEQQNSMLASPSKRRRKEAGALETMPARRRKIDWNRGYCEICMAWPEGETLVECDGSCLRSFHSSCLPEGMRPGDEEDADQLWFCEDCRQGLAVCAACGERGEAGAAVQKCCHSCCGQSFHPACFRRLASAKAQLKIHRDSGTDCGRSVTSFSCPAHYCDRCHLSGDSLRIFRCWTCLVAVHGTCLDSGEFRLSDREIQCRDCTASKKVAYGVPQCFHSRVSDEPKWIASLTDMKTGSKIDLQGKLIFHIGSHSKGGGCDFLIPLANVKFHTQLRVEGDGNVTITYANRNAKHQAEVQICSTTGSRSRTLQLRQPISLSNGDRISIGESNFLYELRPLL